MKNKAEEIIFKKSGLFINGEKYGACIERMEIRGPHEIIIYAYGGYKDDKWYKDTDFHKVEELKKYENIKLYIEK